MTKPIHPVIRHWNQIRLQLCWDSTMLAPALAAMSLFASDRTPLGRPNPTACVDRRGRCFINVEWAKSCPDPVVRFVLLHEVLHLILRHNERLSGRDPVRWNVAGDLVINDVIPSLGIRSAIEAPVDALLRSKHAPYIPANLSVEDVYELLRARGQSQGHGAKGVQGTPGMVGAGCGVEPEGDRPQDQPGGLSPSEWEGIAQSIKNAAASGGNHAIGPLLQLPPSRVRWQALLRELAAAAVSRAGRDVVSWSRKSRRSPINIFLPGTRTNDVRLAIVIDSSGSVGDADLAACISETTSAINAAGVSAFLVVHDHMVRSAVWITPGSSASVVAKSVVGRGGTLFEPAYEAVAQAKQSFAAIVHFTDGYPGDAWPNRPINCARAICALTPDGRSTMIPAGWRHVPIEVPGRH